jgi:DNA (cytosine-5)-methyltransferase 1
MKYISLFAGIGGFDLALQRNGHECVYANEWDKYAAEIYNKNFHRGIDEKEIDTRDIRTVPEDDIPDHDILVGGFPCQAFSIAGKRKGFDDTRGTLFFEIARILRAKKPRLLLLENVKGLLSHDSGNTFKTIISALTELGYDLQWQVLNSKNFGVPQNRERVFVVGNLRGSSRPEVFPIRNFSTTTLRELTKGVSDGYRVYTTDCAKTLKCLGGGLGAKTGLYAVTIERGVLKEKPVVTTLDANYYKGLYTGLDKHQARTGIMEGMKIRRLTPTECERLQGFPDGWTESISDTQRYKCLGNAVTVNVVEYIVRRINEEI